MIGRTFGIIGSILLFALLLSWLLVAVIIVAVAFNGGAVFLIGCIGVLLSVRWYRHG